MSEQQPPPLPPPTIDPTGITEIADGVWVIPDRGVPLVPNVGVVLGDDAALVVDTGMGPAVGSIVLDAARAKAGSRRLLVTLTHFHPEHGYGAQSFAGEADLVVNGAQADELRAKGDAYLAMFRTFGPAVEAALEGVELVEPQRTYEGSTSLDLGGRSVRLREVGLAHTAGDQTVLVEDEGVLFAGDLVEAGGFPIFPYFPPDDVDVDGSAWIRVLGELERHAPRLVVPGHGPIGDASLIATQRRFMETMRDETFALAERGRARTTRWPPSTRSSRRSTPTGCSPSGSASGSAASTRRAPRKAGMTADGDQLDAAVAALAGRFRAALDEPRHAGVDLDAAGVRALVDEPLPEHGLPVEVILDELVDRTAPGLVGSTGGRYLGYVTGGVLPAAAIAHAWAAAVDQNTGLWSLGPAATELEQVVLGWLADLLELPRGGAVFTSGAAGANLVSLAVARHDVGRRLGVDVNRDGVRALPALAVYGSTELHFTNVKALRTLGLGADACGASRSTPPTVSTRRARGGDRARPFGRRPPRDRDRPRRLAEHRCSRPVARNRRSLRRARALAPRRRGLRRLLPPLSAHGAARRRARAGGLGHRRRSQVAQPPERDRLRLPPRRGPPPRDLRGHRRLPDARARSWCGSPRARDRGEPPVARCSHVGRAEAARPVGCRGARDALLRPRGRLARSSRRRRDSS